MNKTISTNKQTAWVEDKILEIANLAIDGDIPYSDLQGYIYAEAVAIVKELTGDTK